MASIVEELRAAEIRRLEAKLQQLRAPTDPTQLGCPAGATMLHVPSVDAADVEGAMEVLERVGAVCLRGAIDGAEARRLGAKMLSYEGRDGQGVTIEAGQVNHGFQRFSGLLDLSPRDFSPLITHPSVLAVAERLLGGRTSPQPNAAAWPAEDHIRLSSIHGAVARPQNGQGWWHVDGPMGQLSPERPLPEHSCSVVAMWALTGFSEQSGGTRIMPGSHLLRAVPPPTDADLPGQACFVGEPGSVGLFQNLCWHAVGHNDSSEPRVAAQATITPWWVGNHGSLERRSWEALDARAQHLTEHMLPDAGASGDTATAQAQGKKLLTAKAARL